jgi:hypothetical protein
MDELALQRAYITDALEAARGDLDAVGEWKLFAAPDDSGMLPFLTADPAVIESAKKNYASWLQLTNTLAKLMQLGEGGGSLTRTTGAFFQGAEDLVAKSRAVKFYDRNVGNQRLRFTSQHLSIRCIRRFSWSAGEKPAGIVDFNDADSYREIVANVNSLNKLLKLTPEQSKALVDDYISAATPEARSVAVINLESGAIRELAKKYDVPESVAEQIYNNYSMARTSALKSIKDNGFMVDTLMVRLLKVPQF